MAEKKQKRFLEAGECGVESVRESRMTTVRDNRVCDLSRVAQQAPSEKKKPECLALAL